jgi:hypothetical protein
MFSEFLGKLKDQISSHLEPKSTCEEQQPSLHDVTMVLKEMLPMHDADPLDTFVGGSGNEVNAHSLSKEKIDLRCVGGSNPSKLQTTPTPSKKLGTESTLANSAPQIQSVKGVDWVVLQPRSSPSMKVSNKKGGVRLKSPLKCGVFEGHIGHIIG